MPQAIRFNALCAATHFDFCYNDYYAIQGHPGFWRKIIDNKQVPEWAIITKAIYEGKDTYFFRDDQTLEELSEFTNWANEPTEEQKTEPTEEQKIEPTEEQKIKINIKAQYVSNDYWKPLLAPNDYRVPSMPILYHPIEFKFKLPEENSNE